MALSRLIGRAAEIVEQAADHALVAIDRMKFKAEWLPLDWARETLEL